MQNRRVIAVVMIALAVGWWATHAASSPFVPHEQPKRPVLKFVARLAKLGLWVAMAAEKPTVQDDAQNRQAVVRHDENGNEVLSHGEGW